LGGRQKQAKLDHQILKRNHKYLNSNNKDLVTVLVLSRCRSTKRKWIKTISQKIYKRRISSLRLHMTLKWSSMSLSQVQNRKKSRKKSWKRKEIKWTKLLIKTTTTIARILLKVVVVWSQLKRVLSNLSSKLYPLSTWSMWVLTRAIRIVWFALRTSQTLCIYHVDMVEYAMSAQWMSWRKQENVISVDM